MKTQFPAWALLFLAQLMGCGTGFGETYYVDFDAGSDVSAGTADTTPWKHCPGDANATGPLVNKALNPGDVVKFKGGVVYRGAIVVNWSGNASSPIQFLGNAWGTEKAILDGTDIITTPWTRCTGPDDCYGNPNWANIWWTPVPAGMTDDLRQLLCNGDQWCPWAQDPNPSDPIFWSILSEWRPVPKENISTTQITDPAYFNKPAGYWDECFAGMWVQGNSSVIVPITSYNASTHTVTVENANPTYTDRDSSFAILNHPANIDVPGEYAVRMSQNRLYVWPPNSVNPSSAVFSYATKDTAFSVRNRTAIQIVGFRARGYYQPLNENGYGGAFVVSTGDPLGCSDTVISDNEAYLLRSFAGTPAIVCGAGTNILIVNNKIHDNVISRGVIITAADHSLVQGNQLSRFNGTGIYAAGITDSLIKGNTLNDIIGIHGNGISVYQNSASVTVAGNLIRNCTTPITYESSKDLTFENNIVDAIGMDQRVNEWGGCSGAIRWINNTLVNNSANTILVISTSGGSATYTIRNNIISGGGPLASVPNVTRDHNLYTGLAWWQDPSYDWSLGPAESVQQNWANIFRDRNASDWRLQAESPAIDVGADVSLLGVTVDYSGAPRPSGAGFDLGAYEFQIDTPAKIKGLRVVPGK